MIERDRVWWCWWKSKRPGEAGASFVACGYSRRAMDVREGVYERGKVTYARDAFEPDDPGDPPRAVEFIAYAPNDLAPVDEQWGEGMMPVKVDLDRAMRMGLQPPPWRDDLPHDGRITGAEYLEATIECAEDTVLTG